MSFKFTGSSKVLLISHI